MGAFGTLLLIPAIVASCAGHDFPINLNHIQISDLKKLDSGIFNSGLDNLLLELRVNLASHVTLGDFAERSVYDCYLTGLDKGIDRDGDAILEVTDTKISASFGLATNDITIHCNWKRNFLFTEVNGTVEAYVNTVSVRGNASLNFVEGAHVELNDFKITHLSPITTDVTGAGGIYDFLIEGIINAVLNSPNTIRQLEQNFADELRKSFYHYRIEGPRRGKRGAR